MIDSLDRGELIMALEQAFDIEIPDNDANKIASVQQAMELIDRLKAKQDTKKSKKKR